ncbi:MAG: WD40 repeat domain-containing protein [Planctomycetota bacterium]|nr:WD40 repeat domain-containing protein [Planctomycetota bacterium]
MSFLRHIRFSLRTLVLFVLLAGSAMGLWWKWEPWGNLDVGDCTRPITCAAFSPGADYVAIGSDDHTVQVWTVSGNEVRTLTGHTGPITAVTWCPSGRLLATASSDGTVRLWNSSDGESQLKIELPHQKISVVTFSNNSQLLAIGAQSGYACVWSMESGTEIARLLGHSMAINQIAFSRDAGLIATASDDGYAAIFDAIAGTELNLIDMTTPEGYSTPAYCVAFSNGGGQLATGDDSGLLRVWDIGKKNPTIPTAQTRGCASALCFSKDDSELYVAGDPCPWNLKALSWRLCGTLPNSAPNLAFRPRGYCDHLAAVSRRMKWSATFHRHPASWDKCSRLHLRYFRRPEYWWGIAWLPEFWLTLVFAAGVVWSVYKDRSTLRRPAPA